MAKKKESEPKEGEIKADDFVARLRAEITKEFGEGIFKSGQDIIDKPTKVLSWSRNLDKGLSGGVPTGTWLSMSGPEKHGKTVSLLCLAAEAQRLGLPVVYLNVEGRLKKMNLVCVNGLDPSPNKFIVIESALNKILSSQDYLKIAEKWLKTCPCFIIIDSISSLADEKELEGGIGTMTRGHNNIIISQFITMVCQLVGPSGSIVAGIVQDYANVSGYGAATREKSATKWKYQADIQIRIKKFDHWTTGSGENEKNIGQILNVEIKTSALGNPYNKVLTYHRYGQGLDKTYELMNEAESIGLIDKGGAGWYTLSFLKDEKELIGDNEPPKIQGAENVLNYIKENPKVYEKLNDKIKELTI